jgi:hypothetical protein
MNKNEIAFAIVFSFCLLSLVSITSAGFLEVSEDLVIVGNGTIDRDFGVHSTPYLTGQKLTETILPVYSSRGNSTSSYRSNFELIMSNNSSIYYESASELFDAKHYLSNKNFELGVYTGFYFIGTQNKSFSFESSPSLSEALVLSEAEGRSVVRACVINQSHYHDRTVDTLTWLEGNYTFDWNFLALKPEYPEAGDGDDWLACP